MAQIVYWALGLGRKHEQSEEEPLVMNDSGLEFSEQDTNGRIGPRWNNFSDAISKIQICTPTIEVTFQEVPLIGTCIMNIQKGGEPKNI